FDEVGMKPDTWDDVRIAGKKIKDKHNVPVGIGLAQEIDTAMAMRAILYSFGASEQDEQGRLVLGSKNTIEAVKFVKALYQETMTPEVYSWDASSNDRAMLAGRASVVLDASEFYNFPCFPKQVPDLKQMLQKDSKGKPPDKYAVLADSLDWATNVGYPGYSNAAIDDIYSQWIVNNMFAKAAQGVMSPEDA